MPMAIKSITSGEIEPKVLRDPGPLAPDFLRGELPAVLVFRDGKEVERLDGLIREDDLADAFDRAAGA
jgi:hypothetical protein